MQEQEQEQVQRLAQMRSRIDELKARVCAADLAESRHALAAAVERELELWDAYVERLQVETAMRAASAREESESAIRDLRRHRNAIAAQLAAARGASDGAWAEQKTRLAAAREELARKADELSAKFN